MGDISGFSAYNAPSVRTLLAFSSREHGLTGWLTMLLAKPYLRRSIQLLALDASCLEMSLPLFRNERRLLHESLVTEE